VMVPAVTGWTTDTSSVNTSTNSFTSTVLGKTVTTVITTSGSDIIFTGTFSDNQGTYVITYHTDSDTFDFDQTVICDLSGFPDSGTYGATYMLTTTMSGAQVKVADHAFRTT